MRTFTIFFVLAVAASLSDAQWVHTNGPYGGPASCFAANGANLFAGILGGGVFRSTNGGTIWTAVNSGLMNTNVFSLAVSCTRLLAGTDNGVFLSTNDGTSWTQAGLPSTLVLDLAVSGTNVFAGTWGGVFLSTSSGATWAEVDSGLTVPYAHALAVSGTNLFVGTRGGGVFLSTNNGTNWTAVDSGLTSTTVMALAVFPPDSSGSGGLFAGTEGGIFLSTNNGTSWTAVDSGLTNTYVMALAASGTNLFAGTLGGGVFLSTNRGTSWTEINSGLTGMAVYSLGSFGTDLFAGTDCGVHFLAGGSSSWTTACTGGNSDVHVEHWPLEAQNYLRGPRGGGRGGIQISFQEPSGVAGETSPWDGASFTRPTMAKAGYLRWMFTQPVLRYVVPTFLPGGAAYFDPPTMAQAGVQQVQDCHMIRCTATIMAFLHLVSVAQIFLPGLMVTVCICQPTMVHVGRRSTWA